MTEPISNSQPKMTRAKRGALERFAAAKGPLVPQYEEIRKDVARALFEAGFVECFRGNDNFSGGYAPLKITEAGRALLQSKGGK